MQRRQQQQMTTPGMLTFSVLASLIPHSLLEPCSGLDFFLGQGRKETHFDPLLFCTKNQNHL